MTNVLKLFSDLAKPIPLAGGKKEKLAFMENIKSVKIRKERL